MVDKMCVSTEGISAMAPCWMCYPSTVKLHLLVRPIRNSQQLGRQLDIPLHSYWHRDLTWLQTFEKKKNTFGNDMLKAACRRKAMGSFHDLVSRTTDPTTKGGGRDRDNKTLPSRRKWQGKRKKEKEKKIRWDSIFSVSLGKTLYRCRPRDC